ncbi:hypothetical protein PF005_g11650 [Phytophthora fragariae]|uniref:Uncharacterized protein n=1 Tax=Phytophthora fragariae TaxID=53985 RepID=A0A6A3JX19_9STRA|nr:hypothetical protein PF003_g20932 [Phytophthora fragariae]KAE8948654.1 hypothetical protein PF009_g1785 [Phytophthora fragariae]KAE8999491.1 hypothetical protein PF011_g14613 [Phytophthora fragariae]KAE9110562.1 hypothetical protein PF010_g11106 [Phytophthora fragariae]KAE9114989.1 hypothetical protein PF007_g10173 [Phytophthora fragariae]
MFSRAQLVVLLAGRSLSLDSRFEPCPYSHGTFNFVQGYKMNGLTTSERAGKGSAHC